MKRFFMFVIALACMCSCSKNDEPAVVVTPPDGTVFSKSFIQIFVVPEEIRAYPLMKNYLQVEFEGDRLNGVKEDVREEFDALCAEYGDMSYNDKIVPYSTVAVGVDCQAIDVVCDRAVDADHPAGSSLADVVKICAVSFREYIESGYVTSPGAGDFPAEFEGGQYNGKGAAALFKPLNEVTAEDLRLIEANFRLLFPEGLAVENLPVTVTVRTENDSWSTKAFVNAPPKAE